MLSKNKNHKFCAELKKEKYDGGALHVRTW